MQKFPKCRYPIFYDTYLEREENKLEAWTILSDRTLPLTARTSAAVQLLHAHFDRSVERAHNEKRLRRHPTFEAYARMLDLQHYRFDADVVQQLRKLIGEPMPGFMEPGTSYFSEAPSVRRKPPLTKRAASR